MTDVRAAPLVSERKSKSLSNCNQVFSPLHIAAPSSVQQQSIILFPEGGPLLIIIIIIIIIIVVVRLPPSL
jgi:hypothetical protein